MKKIKAYVNGKSPIDTPGFAGSYPNVQSKPTLTVASTSFPKKIKTPRMSDKRRSKDRVFTYLLNHHICSWVDS